MADSDDPLTFDPVPQAVRRRDGWTEERQCGFIAALARCGSATAAARQIGKSVRGAYALRERPGGESFARAWDMACVIGADAMRDCVIDRAMHGGWVPVVRRGRIVRMEFRPFDRLAMAVLSGRGRDIMDNCLDRARIREYRRELKEQDRRRKEVQAANQKAWEEAGREMEEKKRRVPRIRSFW